MAIVKWDPLRELRSMQEEMNRLFELSRSRLYGEAREEGLWQPPVDICEDGREVVVRMELPEVNLEDVQVTVEGDSLVIQGVRQMARQREQQNYLRIERCYGPFRRLFALPAGIDRDRIDIGLDRGVLQVVLPKTEAVRQVE